MNRKVLALCAGAALAVPAAHADVSAEVDGGFTCGMASSNDPTGQVNQDPDQQVAVLTGGPWVAAGVPQAVSMTITCAISVDDDHYDSGDVAVSATTPGPVAFLAPTTVAYSAPAGVNVFVCTHVTVYRDGRPPYYRQYDADGDPSNGAQCQRAREDGTLTEVFVSPTMPDGGICTRADGLPSPPAPYSYQEFCTPWWPPGV